MTLASDAHNWLDLHWFELEPGDATHYAFGYANIPEQNAIDGYAFSGADNGEYVLVIIGMSRTNGSYPIMRDSISHPQRHTAQYLAGKINGDVYTCMAVLLALSVLLDTNTNTYSAKKAMLRTREVLSE